jgi:uncharacterized membrane protein
MVVGCAIGGYVLLAHAPHSPWTAALILGPMVWMVLAGLWHARQRVAFVACLIASVVLAWAIYNGRLTPDRLYVAQHAGVHAALAVWFASSLAGVPLITQAASRLQTITPTMLAYTRHVTQAWVAYFVLMVVASFALYAWASFASWSLFATILTPLSLVLMFVGEHVLRYRLHPEFERVTMQSAVRAWRTGPGLK